MSTNIHRAYTYIYVCGNYGVWTILIENPLELTFIYNNTESENLVINYTIEENWGKCCVVLTETIQNGLTTFLGALPLLIV